MRTYVFILTMAATGVLGMADMRADSATAVITISATVRRNCLISTTPVAYGAYDPVGSNATAPLDATGTVVLTCTRGTTASIGLDGGTNSQGPVRRMGSSGGADAAIGGPPSRSYLTYELYKDNSRTNVWSDNGDGMMTVPAAPSKNPRSFTVYGRVAGAQDVPVGSYADSVVATVNF